jgi:gliding motility-associated-like protein
VLKKACAGDTVFITNTSWPASDLTYRWFFGDGDSSTDVNPVHVYHSPGIDSIKLYITNTKCFDSTAQGVVLDNLINAGFTSVPDSFVCQGTPVAFTNTSTGTLLTYAWLFGDGGISTATNPSHTYQNTGTYNILLAVSNYIPCFDTARKSITVDSISAISMNATDDAICTGTSISFDGIFEQGGLREVKWGFGSGDSAFNVNPAVHMFSNPGEYIVFVEAIYRACPDTSISKTFYVFSQPAVSIMGDSTVCPGGAPILVMDNLNANTAGVSWKWNTGETTPGIKIVEPGRYYVKVTEHGCSTTDSITIGNDCYMDIPNAFTPNGDGINDYFFPRTLLTRGLTAFSMQIYNRWGQEIFATTTLDGRGWDGRFNDVAQPEGVYVFIIDAVFKDGQHEHHQGNVTLLR